MDSIRFDLFGIFGRFFFRFVSFQFNSIFFFFLFLLRNCIFIRSNSRLNGKFGIVLCALLSVYLNFEIRLFFFSLSRLTIDTHDTDRNSYCYANARQYEFECLSCAKSKIWQIECWWREGVFIHWQVRNKQKKWSQRIRSVSKRK